MIQGLCEKYGKQIGIIVELKGRKIKVEKFTKDSNIIHLKQGQKIKVITNSKKFTDNHQIVITFKELHKMLNPGDKIIINDNKASLTVENIVEKESSKTRKTSIHAPLKLAKFENKTYNLSSNNLINNIKSPTIIINNVTLNSQNICNNCAELNDNITFDKYDDRICIPRVKTSVEADINTLLDKIENYDLNRIQEINDIKLIEFEQEIIFEADEEEKMNFENKKIDGFIQSIANFSEQKYVDKKNKEQDYADRLKDISSIRSDEFMNLSNNCLDCNNVIQNNQSFIPIPIFNNKIVNKYNIENNSNKYSNKRNKRIKTDKKYEILCTVDYNCSITNNSFLHIPGKLFFLIKI